MNKFLQRLKIFLIAVLCLSLSLLFVACGEPGEKGDKGDKGDTGATGVGIVSIAKDSTVGNVDIYKITMTNGNTSTFTVTNGTSGADGKDGVDGTDGKDGVGITGAIINNAGELVLSFSEGDPINLGKVVGNNGNNGTSLENVTLDNDGNLSVTYGGNTYPLGNVKGNAGKSAYEIYKQYYGYTGTEQQWITDLVNGKLATTEQEEIDHIKLLNKTVDSVIEELFVIQVARPKEVKGIFIGSNANFQFGAFGASADMSGFISIIGCIAEVFDLINFKVGTLYKATWGEGFIKAQIVFDHVQNCYKIFFDMSQGYTQITGISTIRLDENMDIKEMDLAMYLGLLEESMGIIHMDFKTDKVYYLNPYADEQLVDGYIQNLKDEFLEYYNQTTTPTQVDISEIINEIAWTFVVRTMTNCAIMVNYNGKSYLFDDNDFVMSFCDENPDNIEVVAVPMEGYVFVEWSDGVKTQRRKPIKERDKNGIRIYPIVVHKDAAYTVFVNNSVGYQVAYEVEQDGKGVYGMSYTRIDFMEIKLEDEKDILQLYATTGSYNNWKLSVEKPADKKYIVIDIPYDLQESDTYYEPNNYAPA